MGRPKKEDFKVEYIKGVAEISSVTKQYSRAQDLYIDHLEQLLIQRVSKSFYCEKQTNLLKQCAAECDYCKSIRDI